jgi:hypothetical protein
VGLSIRENQHLDDLKVPESTGRKTHTKEYGCDPQLSFWVSGEEAVFIKQALKHA